MAYGLTPPASLLQWVCGSRLQLHPLRLGPAAFSTFATIGLNIMKDDAINVDKLKPAVSKYLLMALAGLMWSAVGIMLCRLAYVWLKAVPVSWALSLGSLGLISALAAYRFGFSKIALKNIFRLCLLPDKTCIFAFQAWKSYLIIVFMVALGLTLRHSPFPKHFLAVIYETIGGALFFSSFHFYGRIWRVKIRKKPCITSEEK
jgi:hypothetical protein